MHPPPHAAAFARLARKVQPPVAGGTPWGAPPIAELITRIDAALKVRRRA